MTIDEALETLQNEQRRNYTEKESTIYKARELGIEALKRIKECRLADNMIAEDYLPGETEEK